MAKRKSWARETLDPLFEAEPDVARAYDALDSLAQETDGSSLTIGELLEHFLPLLRSHSTFGNQLNQNLAEGMRANFSAAFDEIYTQERRPFEAMLRGIAAAFAMISPGWTASQWESVLESRVADTFGGSYITIRKDPARAVRAAARSMTPAQLMTQFGISRSYAYRLVKEARPKKIHKTG